MANVGGFSPSVSSLVSLPVFFGRKPRKTQKIVMSVFNDLKLVFSNLINASSMRLKEHKSTVSSATTHPEWLQVESISVALFLKEFGPESMRRCARFIGFKHIEETDVEKLKQLYEGWKADPSYCLEDSGLSCLRESLHSKLKQEADLLSDLIVRIENFYTYQLDLLDYRRLGLKSRLPLQSYNLLKDRYFIENKKLFEKFFASANELFSKDNVHLPTKESDKEGLRSQSHKLKYNYSVWSVAHEQMSNCLPANYPFRFTNLFKPEEKDALEVADEEEYKSLVSLYVAHFDSLKKALDHLKKTYSKTIEGIQLIKEIG